MRTQIKSIPVPKYTAPCHDCGLISLERGERQRADGIKEFGTKFSYLARVGLSKEVDQWSNKPLKLVYPYSGESKNKIIAKQWRHPGTKDCHKTYWQSARVRLNCARSETRGIISFNSWILSSYIFSLMVKWSWHFRHKSYQLADFME